MLLNKFSTQKKKVLLWIISLTLLFEAYSVSATAFSNKLSESMIMKYEITHYRLLYLFTPYSSIS